MNTQYIRNARRNKAQQNVRNQRMVQNDMISKE